MGKFFKLKYFKTDGIIKHVYSNGHFGNCVLCGKFCFLHGHHVITRSKGGNEEDIINVCPDCHDWIHSHVDLASKRGLYLREYNVEHGKRVTKASAK